MKNIMNIFQNVSLQGITAIGMTIVIITAGIDISVGGVMAMSTWIAALLMKNGIAWPFAVICCLGIAGVCGAVNAFSVGVMKIPPMIATLAMMNMTRGLQTVISKGKTLTGLPESFQSIGQGLHLECDSSACGYCHYIVCCCQLVHEQHDYGAQNIRRGRQPRSYENRRHTQ